MENLAMPMFQTFKKILPTLTFNSRIEKIFFISVLCLFTCIFGLISFSSVYQFKNAALDEGMFNHAIFCFSKLKMNDFLLDINGEEVNFFGDHFAPIVLFLSPLRYVFGIYTLSFIQLTSIVFGGVGVFKIAKLYKLNGYLPLLLMVHFFGIWALYSAVSFGFHTNVLAAMLIPWLIFYFQKEDYKGFLILFFLVLFCKENMSLWLVFILSGLFINKYFVQRKQFNLNFFLKYECSLLVFSVIYFVVIVSKVMPLINMGHGTNQLARYQHLGGNFAEIILFFFSNPIDTLLLYFENNLSDSFFDGIKSELHFFVFVSGGIALLLRPQYFIMLIPIYSQKLLTDNPVFWGINFHYCIEFAPILTIALIDMVRNFSPKVAYIIVTTCVFTTYYFGFGSIEERKSVWYDKSTLNFYNSEHYKTNYDSKKVREALKKIPSSAAVSVSSPLAPDLAFREKIYHFPVIKDAEYLALLFESENTFPLSKNQVKNLIFYDLVSNPCLAVIHNENGLFIAKILNQDIFSKEYLMYILNHDIMSSPYETKELILEKIMTDSIWFKDVQLRARESNKSFEDQLKNEIDYILDLRDKNIFDAFGTSREDYQTIKKNILNDVNWKEDVKKRAEKSLKSFNHQLDEEIKYVLKNQGN